MYFTFEAIAAIYRAIRNGVSGWESGGLLFGPEEDTVELVYELPNSFVEPHKGFAVNAEEMAYAVQNAAPQNLLGTFHSHPCRPAVPSRADLATAELTGDILIVGEAEPLEWKLYDAGGAELPILIEPPRRFT